MALLLHAFQATTASLGFRVSNPFLVLTSADLHCHLPSSMEAYLKVEASHLKPQSSDPEP